MAASLILRARLLSKLEPDAHEVCAAGDASHSSVGIGGEAIQ